MDAQTYITTFVSFLAVIVQFLVGIAFLFFVFNAIRFFVAGAGNDDARARARSLATYGVLAFVVLLIFWGVVNLLTDSLGLAGCTMPQSDYFLQGFIGPMPANCSNLPPAG
ncbi:hypothetical protein KC887_06915 [Candidatus Kaiserbacteria bacterium]|nr:hypothetical protein [Candidatus Kaiserbacteria bacterium]